MLLTMEPAISQALHERGEALSGANEATGRMLASAMEYAETLEQFRKKNHFSNSQ